MKEYEELLKQAGFSLTISGDRIYWRLNLKDSEMNQRAMFRALNDGEEDDTVGAFLFLCKADFTECVMLYDDDVSKIKVEDFIEYINRYIKEIQ